MTKKQTIIIVLALAGVILFTGCDHIAPEKIRLSLSNGDVLLVGTKDAEIVVHYHTIYLTTNRPWCYHIIDVKDEAERRACFYEILTHFPDAEVQFRGGERLSVPPGWIVFDNVYQASP